MDRSDGLRGIAFTLNAMGVAARVRGEPGRAVGLHAQARRLHTELTHPRLANSVCLLGLAREALGDADAARELLREALAAAYERTQPHTVALALEGLGGLAAGEGDAERAGLLLGAATVVRERAQTPPDPIEQADRDRAADAVGRSPAFALGVRRGRDASLSAVVQAEWTSATSRG